MIFCPKFLENHNTNQTFAELSFKWFLIQRNWLNLAEFTKYITKKKLQNSNYYDLFSFEYRIHDGKNDHSDYSHYSCEMKTYIKYSFEISYFLTEYLQNILVFQIHQNVQAIYERMTLKCSIFVSELYYKNDLKNICILIYLK